MAAMPTMVLPAPQGSTMTPRAAADVAAGVEGVDGLALVVAHAERQARSRSISRRLIGSAAPVGVAGQVLGRIADGDQRLLEHAAVGVVDGEAGRVEPLAQVVAHASLPRQLLEQRLVLGDQPKLARRSARAAPGRSG